MVSGPSLKENIEKVKNPNAFSYFPDSMEVRSINGEV